MAMHHFMVMVVMAQLVMVDVVMPMLCHVVRSERPAGTVPEPLPVAQTAAPALRLARRARGAVVGVPSTAMGVLRAAMGM